MTTSRIMIIIVRCIENISIHTSDNIYDFFHSYGLREFLSLKLVMIYAIVRNYRVQACAH